jgi:hypothetical protein
VPSAPVDTIRLSPAAGVTRSGIRFTGAPPSSRTVTVMTFCVGPVLEWHPATTTSSAQLMM